MTRRLVTAGRLVLFVGLTSIGALGCGSTGATPTSDASFDGRTDSSDDGAIDSLFDAPPPPADFGVCPAFPDAGPTSDAGCAACVDDLCKVESTACSADDACVKQVTCLAGCTSSACEADCLTTFPSTAGKARFDCIRCRCEAQCTSTTD